MRRGRHKLQVSTFPFLAVLLAAMGSLILLLLVMDRRAKIVAKNKAKETLDAKTLRQGEREEQRRQELEKQKTEWERRQSLLHDRLLAELQDLLRRRENDADQINQLSGKLRFELDQLQALEKRVVQETESIRKGQEALIQKQALQARHASQSKEFAAERQKLADQLAQLESAWRALQVLKGQEQNTYSLVAYQGKRGENRKPIYVECRRDGLIFHPTAKALMGLAWTPEKFREEVKAQGAELAQTPPAPVGTRKKPATPALTGPYVLFLVRPDAIETYYEAAGALKGYQIDFGYELIEPNWILDFSLAGTDNAGLKKETAGHEISKPGVSFNLFPPGLGKSGTGNGPPTNLAGGGSGSGGPWSNNSGPGLPGHGNGFPGSGSLKPGGLNYFSLESAGNGTGRPRPGFVGGLLGSPGIGVTGAQQHFGPGGSGFNRVLADADLAAPRTGFGSMLPAQLGGEPARGIPATEFSTRQFAGGEGQKQFGDGGPPPGDHVAVSDSPGPKSTGGGMIPEWRPVQNGAQGDRPQPNTQAKVGEPHQGNGGGRDPGELVDSGKHKNNPPLVFESGGGGGEPDPFNRMPPPGPKPKDPPVAKSPPSRLLGNRDFIITIECNEHGATVLPGGQEFSLQQAERLAQHVQKLIARRQASVRPGEPPYRPQLRFSVQADGLRTYFRVYPPLEQLRLPMSRENVED